MDEIELVEYDPSWPAMYSLEAARIVPVLPADLVLKIEHFGSTSIPGLLAKPIIDILVIVWSIELAKHTAVEPLERIGYAYWRGNPKQDRMFFVKGLPPRAPRRTHHVHIMEPGGDTHRSLLFRDYLRAQTDEQRRYSDLKMDLAKRFRDDREAYTDAKAAYVSRVIERAVVEAHAQKSTWSSPIPCANPSTIRCST